MFGQTKSPNGLTGETGRREIHFKKGRENFPTFSRHHFTGRAWCHYFFTAFLPSAVERHPQATRNPKPRMKCSLQSRGQSALWRHSESSAGQASSVPERRLSDRECRILNDILCQSLQGQESYTHKQSPDPCCCGRH